MRAKLVARATKATTPIISLTKAQLDDWKAGAEGAHVAWVERSRFSGRSGELCLLPTSEGGLHAVLLGLGEAFEPWPFASLQKGLPKGRYAISTELRPEEASEAALGFGLGAYVFDRYKKAKPPEVELVWPSGADRSWVERLVDAICLARDLVNTPAQDLGPIELAAAVQREGKAAGATVSVIEGAQLLRKNYPSVHAVGRAAAQAPRLVDLRWGKPAHPKLTIVGKGVCFDSGGLDIKPAGGMLMMKKDMGGAAIALGLAKAVMDAKLPVRLRLLIPAVENAISGNAFHPMDILSTRKGTTVEVGNTDAEGRLILSDALFEGATEKPELMIDFATLTGAARVALGTEVPVMFSNRDDVAEELLSASSRAKEPIWRLPLHQPYRRFLDSPNADISNTGSSRFGGAITAALFLEHFVEEVPWVHFDVMAYNLDNQPGRPSGGEAMALRAVYGYLSQRFGA
ncbi:MAG: leucyl aminopeptidase family protein [Myxococcota bacterium]